MNATDGQNVPQPIAPAEVRYIKLGDGGRWAAGAIEVGYLAFGYHSIPHAVCVAGDRDEIRHLLAHRGSEGAKTAGMNEVMTFYEMGADCLWVTFAGGHRRFVASRSELAAHVHPGKATKLPSFAHLI